MTGYREHVASSGLRVLTEEISGARTAAAGFFVLTGSRDETPELQGVSHFLEHMAFKATKKRSAIEVSRVLDSMGSRANAYTSWERTVYYAQILPEFLPDTIGLLAEMIDPAFLTDDFDTEKKVILEEIEMYNDRPEFLLFENLMEQRYPSHPLSGRILGTTESIKALSAAQMKSYHARRYRAPNVILAVAGAFDRDKVLAAADALTIEAGDAGGFSPAPAEGTGHRLITRPSDVQEHYLVAWPGPKNSDLRERYVANVASVLLGDDEGSRFSWALLHPGIVENVDAGCMAFRDTGVFYSGFAVPPKNFERARDVMFGEIAKFRGEVPGVDELERAKTKYATRTMLSSESMMSRMHSVGDDAVEGVGHRSIEEELKIILSVTQDDIRRFSSCFEHEPASAAIGPLK